MQDLVEQQGQLSEHTVVKAATFEESHTVIKIVV